MSNLLMTPPTLRLAAAAAMLICAGGASAADLYVSANGSDAYAVNSLGTPWKTLAKAALNVKPGDTVWIMNGTYARFNVTVSGTEAAPITWRAYADHKPELVADPTQYSVISVTAPYQVFDGLTVTGLNDTQTLAQAEADYNKSVQKFLKFNPATGQADINPATGLPVTVDIPNPTYVPGYSGDPKFQTNGINIDNRGRRLRAHHITVRNSTLRKLGCAGFSGIETDYITLENNKIYGNAWYARYGCSGATIFTHNMTRGDTTPGYRNVVRGNQFWDNKGLVKWFSAGKYSDGNGFILDISAPDYGGRTLIANNLVVFNGGSGIHAFQGHRVDILNNTAYLNGAVLPSYPGIYARATTDAKLLNNIVYSRPGTYSNETIGNANVQYDYNVYFNGSVAGTLTKVMGPNDLKADPLFNSTAYDPATGPAPGAFALAAASPGVNTGTNPQAAPTFAPAKDIVGTARPQEGAIDRGAYEKLPAQ